MDYISGKGRTDNVYRVSRLILHLSQYNQSIHHVDMVASEYRVAVRPVLNVLLAVFLSPVRIVPFP